MSRAACAECGKERPINHRGLCRGCEEDAREEEYERREREEES